MLLSCATRRSCPVGYDGEKVAERTGFASPSAFILFFKRNTGMTPGQFCEQATEK